MVRRCHSEGLLEQKRMREHSISGKYDVGWRDDSGEWHHVARYSSEDEAEASKERLSDPCRKTRNLIGIPKNPDVEIIER